MSDQKDDMEVDNDKSAVNKSAGWHKLLRFKYICDKKCIEESSKFYDIASILVEGDGKPHTINIG